MSGLFLCVSPARLFLCTLLVQLTALHPTGMRLTAPPIFFGLAKENGPCTVQKKNALGRQVAPLSPQGGQPLAATAQPLAALLLDGCGVLLAGNTGVPERDPSEASSQSVGREWNCLSQISPKPRELELRSCGSYRLALLLSPLPLPGCLWKPPEDEPRGRVSKGGGARRPIPFGR